MPRVTRGTKRRKKRKKLLARAKGYYQRKSKLYRYAKEAVDRSDKFAYIGRRLKKRDFRSLWIIRISAGSRANGLSYNQLIHGLKLAEIDLNRKMLAELAVQDPGAFTQLVERAKAAIEAGPKAVPAAADAPAEASATVTAPDPEPGAEAPAAAEAEPQAEAAPAAEAEAEKPQRKAVKKASPKAEAGGEEEPAKKAAAKKKASPKAEGEEKPAAAKAAKKKAAPKKKAASKEKESSE